MTDYMQLENFKKIGQKLDIKCINRNHEGANIFKDKGVYTYKYSNETGIERTLDTPLGYYDNTGVLIEIDLDQTTDLNSKLRDIQVIATPASGTTTESYLDQHLKGVEFTFTSYDPNLDVFVTNLIVR